ncbi:MAG: hypothetical protein ACI8ZM_004898 [Crocinitomix sp.]|jgi:hypothetical protein
MKKIGLILLLSTCSWISYGQYSIDTLEGNNIRATITNSGAFFNNPDLSKSGYESPIDDGNHLIYSSSFWFGALDEFDNLKMAADLYGGEDYRDTYPGALKADGSAEAPVIPFADEIYVVSKAEIEYHVSNIYTPGYIIPHGIIVWPAHGAVDLGMDFQLAPFADLNGNSLYEPEIGEYPEIRGDHAAYMIMNDKAGPHGMSGGDPLGIEIHYMFYQYETDDEINNTTFINVRVINRSSLNYPEFVVGTYMDSDIGLGVDDYIGCNPENNFMFGYNGNNDDIGVGGAPGYGENPPAVGFKMLNNTMNASVYFQNSAGPYGTPQVASDYWNYMHARWKNGIHVQFGGNGNTTGSGVPTNFMYPSDPTDPSGDPSNWSEITVGNPHGDRRISMATGSNSLMAGQTLCYDYAVMTSSRLGNHLENASSLIDQAPIIQAFYDSQPDTYCDFTLSTPELKKELEMDIYPNPSTGAFFIQTEGEYSAAIYTVDGRKVYESSLLSSKSTIQTDLAPGTYILILNQNGALHPTKIIVQ